MTIKENVFIFAEDCDNKEHTDAEIIETERVSENIPRLNEFKRYPLRNRMRSQNANHTICQAVTDSIEPQTIQEALGFK